MRDDELDYAKIQALRKLGLPTLKESKFKEQEEVDSSVVPVEDSFLKMFQTKGIPSSNPPSFLEMFQTKGGAPQLPLTPSIQEPSVLNEPKLQSFSMPKVEALSKLDSATIPSNNSDYLMELKKALNQQNRDRLDSDLLRSTMLFGSGISGAKQAYQIPDMLEKRAGMDLEKVKELQKGKKELLDQTKTEEELKKMPLDRQRLQEEIKNIPIERQRIQMASQESAMRLKEAQGQLNDSNARRDPNSAISQFVAQEYEKITGNPVPKGFNAEQFKDLGIDLDKLLTKRADLQQKQLEKSKLSDKQVTVIGEYEKPLAMLKDIMNRKSKFETGPLAGRVHTLGGWLGMSDPDKAAFKSTVGESLAQYIKNISGAAVSESERQALLANLPTMNDDDDVFMAKAKETYERIERNKNIELSLMEKQGKNTQSFKSNLASKNITRKQYSPMANKTKITYDDGSTEIVDGRQE
jgi:hypothetical protein